MHIFCSGIGQEQVLILKDKAGGRISRLKGIQLKKSLKPS